MVLMKLMTVIAMTRIHMPPHSTKIYNALSWPQKLANPKKWSTQPKVLSTDRVPESCTGWAVHDCIGFLSLILAAQVLKMGHVEGGNNLFHHAARQTRFGDCVQ
jgi:uncharacterized protein Smg (DUF494 family)